MQTSKKPDSKVRRVIFLGRKSRASRAAQFLVDQGIVITLIVCPKQENGKSSLQSWASSRGIPIIHEDTELYRLIEKNDPQTQGVDLVISYLYWRKMRMPLIRLGSRGCINFHPAPLPDYKSRAGYNTALLEGRKEFGVSAHFVDSEAFDAGPIIDVLTFPIKDRELALSLIHRTQDKLLELFKKVAHMFINSDTIPTHSNEGGLYLTGSELERLKEIDLENETPDRIRQKIRAFFFPPYHGATIRIAGEKFTLVDDETLAYLAQLLRRRLTY